jgi:hypothetical protein
MPIAEEPGITLNVIQMATEAQYASTAALCAKQKGLVADHLLETHFPGCERSSKMDLEASHPASLPSDDNWQEALRTITED